MLKNFSYKQEKGIPPQMVLLRKKKQKRRREVFLAVQNGHGGGLQLRDSDHPTCIWGVSQSPAQTSVNCWQNELVRDAPREGKCSPASREQCQVILGRG